MMRTEGDSLNIRSEMSQCQQKYKAFQHNASIHLAIRTISNCINCNFSIA